MVLALLNVENCGLCSLGKLWKCPGDLGKISRAVCLPQAELLCVELRLDWTKTSCLCTACAARSWHESIGTSFEMLPKASLGGAVLSWWAILRPMLELPCQTLEEAGLSK